MTDEILRHVEIKDKITNPGDAVALPALQLLINIAGTLTYEADIREKILAYLTSILNEEKTKLRSTP